MNDKLHHALNEISDKHLSEAENYQRSNRRPYWIIAAAAILGLVIGITAIGPLTAPAGPTGPIGLNTLPPFSFDEPENQSTYPAAPEPSGIQSPDTLQLADLAAAPAYPQMAQQPEQKDYPDYDEYSALVQAWKESCKNQYDQPDGYADSLTDFFTQSIPQFLDPSENSSYSPVNAYMALAMLAETTDGNSRQQILDALGLDTIEQLREQVSHVWNAHYSDDGVTTLLLGNSLWLSDRFSFHQECLPRSPHKLPRDRKSVV